MIPHKNSAHKEPFKLCTSCDIMVSYIWYLSSHDSDTPLTQWSYCRPKIPVCWMQLDPRPMSNDKSTTTNCLEGHNSFWTSVSLSGIPPPSKNKHMRHNTVMPCPNCDSDAKKMCNISPLIDHSWPLVPTFSLSAPIKWVGCSVKAGHTYHLISMT